MKRFILTLLVLISVSANFAYAQTKWADRKSQMTIGVGIGSSYTIVESITFALFDGLSDQSVDKFDNGFGAWTIGYMYNINKHIGLGIDHTYESTKVKFKDSDKEATLKHNSFLPTARAYWFNNAHFSMYSKLSLGCALLTYKEDGKKDTEFGFAYQISPVGLEVGGSKVRGFAEAGWGMQGILNLGVRIGY